MAPVTPCAFPNNSPGDLVLSHCGKAHLRLLDGDDGCSSLEQLQRAPGIGEAAVQCLSEQFLALRRLLDHNVDQSKAAGTLEVVVQQDLDHHKLIPHFPFRRKEGVEEK